MSISEEGLAALYADLEAWKEMGKQLEAIKENLKLLFHYLDYTEESDSGREFHPIHFSWSLLVRCLLI